MVNVSMQLDLHIPCICPKLANVKMDGCKKVDGAGLKHLLKLAAPNSIEVPGTGVTLLDAKAFMKKKPGAKVFR